MNTIHLQSIDSTQTYAKTHAHTFPPDLITCIVADTQTAGKGKFQRPWHSPADVNLYTTFYFRLHTSTPDLISLSGLLAVSLTKILIQKGFDPQIKWPNDLLLSGKKMAGILCETVFRSQFIEVFLGIGINVNMEKEECPFINQPVTSLKMETGHDWDLKELLQNLRIQFSHDLTLFKTEGFLPFHTFYNQHLIHKGSVISFFDGKKTQEGIFHSVTECGKLNLQLPNQLFLTYYSGEYIIL